MATKKEMRNRLNKHNYEPNAPRCEYCKFFRKPGLVLFDSIPRFVQGRCLALDYALKHGKGLCDRFEDKCTGETLGDVEDVPLPKLKGAEVNSKGAPPKLIYIETKA